MSKLYKSDGSINKAEMTRRKEIVARLMASSQDRSGEPVRRLPSTWPLSCAYAGIEDRPNTAAIRAEDEARIDGILDEVLSQRQRSL
jgi:hypothetical protein